MDRCALAYQYHQEGWNCAQSVAGACADLAGKTPEEILPLLGGFGGGFGGSHEEACGAISGGVLVLSLCFPFAQSADQGAKRELYACRPAAGHREALRQYDCHGGRAAGKAGGGGTGLTARRRIFLGYF